MKQVAPMLLFATLSVHAQKSPQDMNRFIDNLMKKMTLEEKEFNLIKAEKEATQPKKRQVNVVKRSNTSGPRARLDLRGKRYEEAMQELDGFIDQALLNNMAQVDIIHGIGTGVIREGVSKYLRRNKHVKSFEYAPQNAGGSGATIVTFKG